MVLDKYRGKRDFKKTIEPQGKIKKGEKESLGFVVQKHAASHLHFDFRLEAEGVLKSWAVPKGIPLPGEKRLAMMVEDHPLEYGGFEGTIPEGNYGAGTVMLWDRGIYFPKEEGGVAAGIKRGNFGFRLKGEKIRGQFSLVKLKKGQENSWLFICQKAEEIDGGKKEVSVLSGKSMEEIGNGDGISFENIEGVLKEKMPAFIKPMFATLIDKPFDDENWLFEIKWDGYRVMARKEKNKVDLFSRNHKNFNENFFPIMESLKKIKGDFILDGEVVAVDEKGKTSFQMLQNYMDSRKGILVYYVFDILYLNGYDLRQVSLEKRKEILKKFLPTLTNVKISEHIDEMGQALFDQVVHAGNEGIIGKKKTSIYQAGVRSKEWVKIKSVASQEAVIGGFTAPRGGRKKFGALVLGVWQNNELIYIGHTGGGFDDKTLEMVHKKISPLATDKSPFKIAPQTNAPVTWIKPEIVCQVKFAQWTDEGIMRQPIFLGLRADLGAKDATRELPDKKSSSHVTKKIYKSIEKDEIEKEIGGHKLRLTNLSKVYWPDDGYTKEDLINYYLSVADIMLPHLKNKPQSLHRFPNGIEAPSFFQKDVHDAPEWIHSIDIFSESEQKTIRYLLCQNKATLIYLANLGCIEINVWNSSVGSLEKPDFLVFDIDPNEIEFSQAIKVAQETKKILDKIKVKGYCKTSGSRGLHIYVPLQEKYTYEQAKEFARLINIIVNKNLPDITSLERKPHERMKKVYLDYLQNRQGQTMAAPYSVRPQPGAPVSTPLEWEEVNEKLNPHEFNIKTIKKRIKTKGDLWKNVLTDQGIDMQKALNDLEKLIEQSKI